MIFGDRHDRRNNTSLDKESKSTVLRKDTVRQFEFSHGKKTKIEKHLQQYALFVEIEFFYNTLVSSRIFYTCINLDTLILAYVAKVPVALQGWHGNNPFAQQRTILHE
jgi:hypothetical protein